MTWDEFTHARETIASKLGKKISLQKFEKLLGLKYNSSPKWKPTGLPDYIACSVEAHAALNKTELEKRADKMNIFA